MLGPDLELGSASSMGTIPQDLIDAKQVDLFNAIDQLSALTTTRGIEPPQLIVVGDQSNGKSSVLEAIARFHFPVAQNLCTRFPTKIILRTSDEERTVLSVTPSASRSDEEKTRLRGFSRRILPGEDLHELIREATEVIGVASGNKTHVEHSRLQGAFSNDTLVIERLGKGLPILSLVDLPGLFQSTTADQGEESLAQVKDMVRDYISSKRNLVLLVVSARSQYSTHIAPAMI